MSFFTVWVGFSSRGLETQAEDSFPPLNIGEDEENLYIFAEVAGVDVEDLELCIEGRQLILEGERISMVSQGSVLIHHRERKEGPFRRQITLPPDIDLDRIKAECRNGILSIVLPRRR